MYYLSIYKFGGHTKVMDLTLFFYLYPDNLDHGQTITRHKTFIYVIIYTW